MEDAPQWAHRDGSATSCYAEDRKVRRNEFLWKEVTAAETLCPKNLLAYFTLVGAGSHIMT